MNYRFPRSLAEAFPVERAYAVEIYRSPSLWRQLAGGMLFLAVLLLVSALIIWGRP